MESQPPPGYNPNVSLLQGGTDVRIMPVQGGGGLVSNYNHTVSLLEGGNEAPIQAISGGGVSFSDKNQVVEFDPTNKPNNLLKKKDTGETTNKDKGFKADPNAVKAETEDVEISREKFALRKPLDPVKKDWEAAKYSQGEADFLNTLKLSPTLLESIYKMSWKKEVSLFLETMSVASCFKDHELLLKSECDASRKFLQKVYYKNYSNTLEELYDKWGSKTPSEDSKDVLNKLIQAISSLSASSVGEVEMTTIDEKDFQGDPEGRYIKMNVDTDRDSPSYFANFVEEVDGKKTYKRIYGEPKDIITKYKELKKGKTRKSTKTTKLDTKLKTLKTSYKGIFSKLLGQSIKKDLEQLKKEVEKDIDYDDGLDDLHKTQSKIEGRIDLLKKKEEDEKLDDIGKTELEELKKLLEISEENKQKFLQKYPSKLNRALFDIPDRKFGTFSTDTLRTRLGDWKIAIEEGSEKEIKNVQPKIVERINTLKKRQATSGQKDTDKKELVFLNMLVQALKDKKFFLKNPMGSLPKVSQDDALNSAEDDIQKAEDAVKDAEGKLKDLSGNALSKAEKNLIDLKKKEDTAKSTLKQLVDTKLDAELQKEIKEAKTLENTANRLENEAKNERDQAYKLSKGLLTKKSAVKKKENAEKKRKAAMEARVLSLTALSSLAEKQAEKAEKEAKNPSLLRRAKAAAEKKAAELRDKAKKAKEKLEAYKIFSVGPPPGPPPGPGAPVPGATGATRKKKNLLAPLRDTFKGITGSKTNNDYSKDLEEQKEVLQTLINKSTQLQTSIDTLKKIKPEKRSEEAKDTLKSLETELKQSQSETEKVRKRIETIGKKRVDIRKAAEEKVKKAEAAAKAAAEKARKAEEKKKAVLDEEIAKALKAKKEKARKAMDTKIGEKMDAEEEELEAKEKADKAAEYAKTVSDKSKISENLKARKLGKIARDAHLRRLTIEKELADMIANKAEDDAKTLTGNEKTKADSDIEKLKKEVTEKEKEIDTATKENTEKDTNDKDFFAISVGLNTHDKNIQKEKNNLKSTKDIPKKLEIVKELLRLIKLALEYINEKKNFKEEIQHKKTEYEAMKTEYEGIQKSLSKLNNNTRKKLNNNTRKKNKKNKSNTQKKTAATGPPVPAPPPLPPGPPAPAPPAPAPAPPAPAPAPAPAPGEKEINEAKEKLEKANEKLKEAGIKVNEMDKAYTNSNTNYDIFHLDYKDKAKNIINKVKTIQKNTTLSEEEKNKKIQPLLDDRDKLTKNKKEVEKAKKDAKEGLEKAEKDKKDAEDEVKEAEKNLKDIEELYKLKGGKHRNRRTRKLRK